VENSKVKCERKRKKVKVNKEIKSPGAGQVDLDELEV
jgi:hypothetical protein